MDKKIKGKIIDNLENKEKYYICSHCGELKTQSQILNECGNGGMGLCNCEFMIPFWSEKYDCIDIDTPRIYNDYTEISEDLYNRLKSEHNEVLRLNSFNCVPKNKLLSYDSYVYDEEN